MLYKLIILQYCLDYLCHAKKDEPKEEFEESIPTKRRHNNEEIEVDENENEDNVDEDNDEDSDEWLGPQ